MLLQIDPRARIFVLDTGRLHQETYDLMARTMSRYDLRYEVLFPAAEAVQEMVAGARPQPVLRQHRRPQALLRGAQGGAAGAGARRCRGLGDRAAPRAEPGARRDSGAGVGRRPTSAVKANPLAEWSEAQVWDYLRSHGVPYNVLHDQGFLSIGCAPCTRAVEPGEPARAGRWWWEQGGCQGVRPAPRRGGSLVTALQRLEAQSVYILREAYREFPRLCMLWSIGKDSTVLLWLTRKAFFGEGAVPAGAHRYLVQDPGDDRLPRPCWCATGG